MITSALTKQAKQDFDIVLALANTIGLADNPPLKRTQTPTLTQPSKRHKTRRLNHSDLLPLERNLKSQEVRRRSLTQRAAVTAPQDKSARKGSVKDVFMERVKAYEDPQQFIEIQKTILRNDYLRSRKQARDAKRIADMAGNKLQRSNILTDISAGLPPKNNVASTPQKSPISLFGTKKTGNLTSRSLSFQKLAVSLDCSKFKLVPRLGGVSLLVQQRDTSRSVVTAGSKRQKVEVRFNTNNKVEMFYPKGESQSELC